MDIKQFVASAVMADTTLQTLIGSRFYSQYPSQFTDVPLLVYLEENQRQLASGYSDDLPRGYDSVITFHIFSNASPQPIFDRLIFVLNSIQYGLDFATDVPEPDNRLFHKTCRFRRALFVEDLA